MDSILDFVVSHYANLYVLFDDEEWLQKARKRYGGKIHYLQGNAKEMDWYGIPALEPILFTFKNNKIVDYGHFANKK
jgi:hypothetical protein